VVTAACPMCGNAMEIEFQDREKIVHCINADCPDVLIERRWRMPRDVPPGGFVMLEWWDERPQITLTAKGRAFAARQESA